MSQATGLQKPFGDLCDRFTILLLRALATPAGVAAELDADAWAHWQALVPHLADPRAAVPDIRLLVLRLLAVNARIWALESDVRRGREGELGLIEVGRRALDIREWNAQRIALINQLTTWFHGAEGPVERKVDHASSQR